MTRLFDTRANMAMSVTMLLAGILISVLNIFGVVGKDEPFWVFQMSAVALWYSAYGNILIAVVRHEQHGDRKRNTQ